MRSVPVALLAVALLAGCTGGQRAADRPPPSTQVASASGPAARSPAPAPATGTPLAAVPANRWRAVLVAGDVNSPAFDNAIEAFRDKLAARGVQNVRLLSTNPAKAAAGQIASSGNVRSAVRGMTGDACLVFITAHGETKGMFMRQDRRFVEPRDLDAALSGCGNVPTVAILSGCHSGTFITPEMTKPNRIILTAAAKDRTSFGCGVRDVFTYYDQCLLRQYDAATTWRELAATTRSCVEGLERTLAVRATSEPQTFVGAAVADLRLPGK